MLAVEKMSNRPNGNRPKYDYNTFEEVFAEIGYAFEAQYGCSLHNSLNGVWTFEVYKLTIHSDGTMQYKSNINTYDPVLWPRIELLAKVMTKDPTLELIYLK